MTKTLNLERKLILEIPGFANSTNKAAVLVIVLQKSLQKV